MIDWKIQKTLLDNIPAAQFHAGSRIKFGPDHKLYVTTGDATNKSLPQNKKSLGGKILRLNTDGTVPVDNPEEGSFIYSYGHRNPQGLAWDPKSGELYGTEHGPSGSDGPPGGDEVNHIVPGGNYGWPLVSHNDKYAGTEEPLRTFTPAIAPSGAMFYAGTLFPGLTGKLLFTGLIGEGLFTATIDAENPDHMYDTTKLSGIDVGRIRDVVEGPDGALYLLTSNRDSRGDVREGDDKVIRLTPGQ
ncbi:MAG: PQQ-dependent sugar dehydrogenase [Candidatus Moraniibacteriota bacterium]